MSKTMNSVASCALVLLTISFAHGQKRGTKGVPSKQIPPRQQWNPVNIVQQASQKRDDFSSITDVD